MQQMQGRGIAYLSENVKMAIIRAGEALADS